MKSNINHENDQPIASNSTQTKSPDNGIKQYDWDCKIKIQLRMGETIELRYPVMFPRVNSNAY